MKQKHTFRYTNTHAFGTEYEVEVSTNEVSLTEIIAAFENYLKGCGFILKDEHLELVEEENEDSE